MQFQGDTKSTYQEKAKKPLAEISTDSESDAQQITINVETEEGQGSQAVDETNRVPSQEHHEVVGEHMEETKEVTTALLTDTQVNMEAKA